MQLASLRSDMAAFKAANPGCQMADFIRWHSPRDYTEAPPWAWAGRDLLSQRVYSCAPSCSCFPSCILEPGTTGSPVGPQESGELSARMSHKGNTWVRLWEQIGPAKLSEQPPLFDPIAVAEEILSWLRAYPPQQLQEDLVLSALGVCIQTMCSGPVGLLAPVTECGNALVAFVKSQQGELGEEAMQEVCGRCAELEARHADGIHQMAHCLRWHSVSQGMLLCTKLPCRGHVWLCMAPC